MKSTTAALLMTLSLVWQCPEPAFSQASAHDAAALLERGHPMEALAALRQGGLSASSSAEECFMAGRCFQMLLETESAHTYLALAIEKEGGELARRRMQCHLAAALLRTDYELACQRLNEQITAFAAPSYELAEALSLLGAVHTRNEIYELAEPLLLQSLEVFHAVGEGGCSQAGVTHRTLGILLWRDSKYEAALEENRLAERIFLDKGGEDNYHLWSLYLNWLGCCNDMGAPEMAIERGRKGLAYLTSKFPENQYLPRFYNNLGNACKVIGDYPAAIGYFREGIALEPRAGRLYNNLGDVYSVSGDTASARLHFLKAIELLLLEQPQNAANLARPYHNLATLARQQGNFQTALDDEMRSLHYRKKAYEGELHLDIARTCTGIGESWAGIGEPEKAIAWLDSALLVQHRVLPKGQHPEIASAWLSKARVFSTMKDLEGQEAALNGALSAFGWVSGDVSPAFSSLGLVEALSEKALFHLNRSRQGGTAEDVRTAVQLYAAAIETLRLHRRMLPDEGVRSSLTGSHFALFEQAMTAAASLFASDSSAGAESAFLFAEQSKSLALLESIKAAEALHFSSLPDSLLETERQLRSTLSALELKMSEASDSVASERSRTQYFQAKLAHERFIKNLEENHAEYHRLKYETGTASLETLRSDLLRPGQTLLEYFVGDGSIFLFAVRDERIELKEVAKDFPLEEWVRRLRSCVSEERTTGSVKYAELAWSLYQKLLLPLGDLPGEDLLIVPDGILGLLPFELLLTEKPLNPLNFRTHRYFLHRHRVSYCYSATLLQEMRNKRHRREPEASLLAFAPFFEGDTTLLAALFPASDELRKDLKPLPNSGEEAFAVAKIARGKALFGSEASEQTFAALAGNYRMLHLSTHGQADDRSGNFSFLAFAPTDDSLENELLYVREVYDLSLNADLVVLSACETGIGKLQKGEGIISLARAFTYAGAKSIVTSLWSVSDPKTKDLMLGFYRHLKKGNDKDEALRQAKLGYLGKKNLAHPNAHPFYWAGFIAIGDMRTVDF